MVAPVTPTPENDEAPRRRPQSTSDHKIILGKFEIDSGRTVTSLEHEYAEAFECSSSETGQNDHVAIVIKGRYPVRRDIVGASLNNDINGMMALRAAQVIAWPFDGTHRYALIYKRAGGNVLFAKHFQHREAINEDLVKFGIIRPIYNALRVMSDRGLFHGNIRPDNIYLANRDNAEAVLGECASSVPGINQPVIFETIERGMADPESRGIGTAADDIYSFGATISILLQGHNPMEGRAGATIIEDKLIRGSYAVLTDGLRLSPAISEFLRATLNDDPKLRWDLDQISTWLEGSRIIPKQSSPGIKAQRSIDFNGRKYFRARMLAKDLHTNVAEAIALIESGNLGKWLERALNDLIMFNAFNASVSRANSDGRTTGYEERLLCLVSMALDPSAPIRYKNLNFFPGGLGYAMVFSALKDNPIQIYGEIIRERYCWIWLNHKDNSAHHELAQIFDQASKMIIRRGINYGIERCLYELCPDIPCLSELFPNHYVSTCGNLLKALDNIAEKQKDKRPIDRHIASFITTRDNKDNAGIMLLLDGGDNMRRSLGLLTMYQQLQKRHDNIRLEHLSQWLVKDAELIAQRFKNLALKNDVLKQIPKEAKTGNLTNMLILVDQVSQVKKDDYEFLQATHRYLSYGREQDKISRDLNNNPSFGFGSGRQLAMMISIMIAGVMVFAVFMIHFAGGKV